MIYYLWQMLGENEVIHQMDVERDLKFTDYIKRDTNLYAYFDLKSSRADVFKKFRRYDVSRYWPVNSSKVFTADEYVHG